MDQLNGVLERTAIGVILLSENYVRSDYCMDEARQLKDGLLGKRVKLLPVKLDATQAPSLLSGLQYVRFQNTSVDSVIARFLASANPE